MIYLILVVLFILYLATVIWTRYEMIESYKRSQIKPSFPDVIMTVFPLFNLIAACNLASSRGTFEKFSKRFFGIK